jgi:hypothetical protein
VTCASTSMPRETRRRTGDLPSDIRSCPLGRGTHRVPSSRALLDPQRR